MCSVFLQESEKVVSISSDHLEPVTPTKNNKVTTATLTVGKLATTKKKQKPSTMFPLERCR